MACPAQTLIGQSALLARCPIADATCPQCTQRQQLLLQPWSTRSPHGTVAAALLEAGQQTAARISKGYRLLEQLFWRCYADQRPPIGQLNYPSKHFCYERTQHLCCHTSVAAKYQRAGLVVNLLRNWTGVHNLTGSFGKHSCSGYMCSVILARCKLIINSNIWKNTLAQKLWSFRAGTWCT
ncbi:hypothetical protein T01_879 [Trichinella spiralis]|uniref:Uncharacterized protein n=1 Tax=Trichinella spiralis TaxID=6334 RepID=A0A0V1B9R9_TRISP|nr:hypothetical protein T01_879 [Trichinella spiralis]